MEILIDFELSSTQLEIKDMINDCLELLVEVFIKVMSGLI